MNTGEPCAVCGARMNANRRNPLCHECDRAATVAAKYDLEIARHQARAANFSTEPCPHCHGRGILPAERVCANERCSRRFRWQDDLGGKHARLDAIYCSNRCAKAQAERTLRRRKKASA